MKPLGLLLLAVCLQAQIPPPAVTVTVNYSRVQKIWNFIFLPSLKMTFTCIDPSGTAPAGTSQLQPGQSSLCTVAFSAATLGAVHVQITVGTDGVLAPDPSAAVGVVLTAGDLLIPAGSTTGTFLVVNSNPLIAMRFMPLAYSIWVDGLPQTEQTYTDIGVPCCARADHCGLDASEIALEPCA